MHTRDGTTSASSASQLDTRQWALTGHKILDAMKAVEQMADDPLLDEAVDLLDKALSKVADFVAKSRYRGS